jgi:protein ImuB
MTTDLSANRRYCAVFLPLLSADNWLREHPRQLGPRAFVDRAQGAMRIIAVDEIAEALGLTPGMALADARARVPELDSVPYDPQADAQLLDRLADACDRFTPSVALDSPDGLILDITGCAHLWDGESGLVTALATLLVRQGMTLRLALADTPDQARALARHGGELLRAGRRIRPSQINDVRPVYDGVGTGDMLTQNPEPMGIEALSVRALGLGEDRTTALHRAGLVTLGDLATRPRAPLAARFGADAVTRLARLLGEEDVRITPRRTPPALTCARRFAEPVARTDFIHAALHALAADAGAELARRGQGGRVFAVQLFRSDGARHRLQIETGQATRDPDLVMRLLGERIETLSDPLDPGFGYDLIRLDIAVAEPLAATQPGLDGRGDGAQALSLLTDRLSVRLGAGRVRRFAAGDSHIPECAGFTVPAGRPVLPLAEHAAPAGEPPLRPVRMLDPPQIVDVIAEVPDGPPRRFRWRRQTHDITAFEGPERIAAEWWKRRDGAGLTRDYYRVEDSAGRRFWMFRHGLYGAEKTSPDWYLHGLFG